MELRHYGEILGRSWPLVLGLPLVVLLLSIGLYLSRPARYGMTVAMLVTQAQIARTTDDTTLPDYDNWNSWAASEFIVDDLLQIVETRRFAEDVAAIVKQEHNLDLDPSAITAGIEAERKHRTVYLSVEAGGRDAAKWLADAAVANLQNKGLEYWNRSDTAQLNVVPLDMPPQAGRVPGTTGLVLDLAVRTLLALLLAVGIAFLRHYLDTTVRRRDDVEALGLDIVGAIPK
jgi:capsular polysaccharide biosynthesis protein